jgi:myo-inositol-1(or 4)-monophosphatase
MPEFLTTCEQAVREAGRVLLEKMGKVRVQEKGRFDLVTDADLEAQDVVQRIVLEAWPGHSVMGEEDQQDTSTQGRDSAYRWIVDPLDGTTNFVHGVPHFCVSLALESRGELVVGAVYNPVAQECFTAAAGEGAWLNGSKMGTSGVAELSEALGAVGLPPVVHDDSPDLQLFLRAVKVCQSMRRTGSAALNLCFVAAGRFDLAWSYCAKPWDVAAGVLLIVESGGVVTSPDGGPFVVNRPRFIAAANRRLHDELIRLAGVV